MLLPFGFELLTLLYLLILFGPYGFIKTKLKLYAKTILNLNMTHLRAHFNNNKVAQRFRLQIGNAFIEDEQWTWVVQHRITTSISDWNS